MNNIPKKVVFKRSVGVQLVYDVMTTECDVCLLMWEDHVLPSGEQRSGGAVIMTIANLMTSVSRGTYVVIE